MTTKTGTVLNPATAGARIPGAWLPAEKAIAEAIRAYLAACTFYVTGTTPPRSFVFASVASEWPDPREPMPYPSAVVQEVTPTRTEPARRVPTPLDESRDVFAPCSVLWKLGEAEAELSLDVWTTNDAERDAVRASLPGLFAPGEEGCVLLSGPEAYFCLTVRAELVDVTDRDRADSVYAHERRLQARLRGSVDIVELRRASLLAPSVESRIVTAGEE